MEGLAVGEEAEGMDFLQSARILQQQVSAHESGLVRVGFMGEAKLEDVLARATDSSIQELWQRGDKIICSVVRQVWLQIGCYICKTSDSILCLPGCCASQWLIIRGPLNG